MTYLIRWHEADDENKLNSLVKSMTESGWQGSPLVKWGEQLYTGAHRSTAADIVGIEFPTIELTEIFSEFEIDFDEACWMFGYPTADDPQMASVINQLPMSARDKYGLDLE